MYELVFRTTNKAKFAHLEFVAKDFSVLVKTVGDYGKPYTEPKIEDREALLEASIHDALMRDLKKRNKIDNRITDLVKSDTYDSSNELLGIIKEGLIPSNPLDKVKLGGEIDPYNGTPFIIEDTSLIIDALSDNGNEFPGVDVKYWMQDTTFDEIDRQLKLKGNNRSVTVRSDVILVIPKEGLIRQFTSSTKGSITDKDIKIETNPVYPWLDNVTFNKWFVPEGCSLPISTLNVYEAAKYDFRIKAFKKLFSYLLDKEHIYKASSVEEEKQHIQLKLLKQPTFLISGPTCAGKTVLAKHINKRFSYYHIEASDFMYLSYYKLHGTSGNISIHNFAKAILKENPKIVAEKIIPFVKAIKDLPVVITGFRDPKEVEYFLSHYEEDSPVKLIYIDCNQKIRYKRNILRGRYDTEQELSKFQDRDKIQYEMGLESIRGMDISNFITNESSIREFYSKFDKNLTFSDVQKFYAYKRYYKELITEIPKLRNLILLTLLDHYSDEHYTTTQITHLINDSFKLLFKKRRKPLSPSNVGRFFNTQFYPYFEIKLTSRKRNSYRLSQTGISEAKLQLHLLLQRIS